MYLFGVLRSLLEWQKVFAILQEKQIQNTNSEAAAKYCQNLTTKYYGIDL